MNAILETVHGREKHAVVSEKEWLAARLRHLEKEKEFTRRRDELSRERRELPWQVLAQSYVFDTQEGAQSLADLFDGRSQLVVYHFMLGPGWKEGCHGCSFVSDHIDGMLPHLEHHDVSLVVVSRAPLAEINAFKQRMGWHFKWVSSNRNDFNFDYHVSFGEQQRASGKIFYNYRENGKGGDEQPGASVFYKDPEGCIFHTYSSYERGLDILVGTYNYLDLTPKGRNEKSPMEWMKHHDKYEAASKGGHDCCGGH